MIALKEVMVRSVVLTDLFEQTILRAVVPSVVQTRPRTVFYALLTCAEYKLRNSNYFLKICPHVILLLGTLLRGLFSSVLNDSYLILFFCSCITFIKCVTCIQHIRVARP